MAEKQLKTRIQLKIDTEENWSKAMNFIPKEGEVIFYKPDDGNPRYRIKIGDGTTAINSLSFAFDIDTELSATSINPVQNSVINTALSSKAEKGNFIPFVTATYSKTESNDTFYTATVDEWSDANTIDDLEGRIAYIKLGTDVSTSNAKISFNGFDAMYIVRRTSGTNEVFTSTFNDALVSEVPFLALIGRIYFGNITSLRCIVLDQGTRAYGGSDFANPVNIDKGGTGSSTPSGALTNLGAVAKAGDTMGGTLIANATSVATLGTAQVRNILAGTSDISEVEGSLNEGDIYLQYEEG